MSAVESLLWLAPPLATVDVAKYLFSKGSKWQILSLRTRQCISQGNSDRTSLSPLPRFLEERSLGNTSLGRFSHPSLWRLLQNHNLQTSHHSIWPPISKQKLQATNLSSCCAFMDNPALSWHSSEIPWLKSPTFFFFFATEQWTFTQSLKSHLPPYFFLLSFNTFL